MQGGTDSSEFRIPDSELEGSVETPRPQPAAFATDSRALRQDPLSPPHALRRGRALRDGGRDRLRPGLSCWPQRLVGRRQGRLPKCKSGCRSRARCCWIRVRARSGATRGPSSSSCPPAICLTKPLPIAGLRPSDPPPVAGDATSAALAAFGGAATRAEASGNFTFFVPAAGRYRILMISHQAARGPDERPEQSDLSELGKYFESPADLLKGYRYRWLTKDLSLGAARIDVEFNE